MVSQSLGEGKTRRSLTGCRESSSLFARRLNETGRGETESACAPDFSNRMAHYVCGREGDTQTRMEMLD
jgi:hypothetical protein